MVCKKVKKQLSLLCLIQSEILQLVSSHEYITGEA